MADLRKSLLAYDRVWSRLGREGQKTVRRVSPAALPTCASVAAVKVA
jgi:hypothetical protein